MGPLASEQIRKRYHRFGRALLSYNHDIILETAHVDYERRGFYVRPAIYRVNWTNGAPILDEEPAGPMLLIYEVQSIQRPSIFTTAAHSDECPQYSPHPIE